MKKKLKKDEALQLDFFDPIDISILSNLTKNDLLELIKMLNEQMIASLENWDGG